MTRGYPAKLIVVAIFLFEIGAAVYLRRALVLAEATARSKADLERNDSAHLRDLLNDLRSLQSRRKMPVSDQEFQNSREIRPGSFLGRFNRAMESRDFLKLLHDQQLALLGKRYGSLYRELGLEPAQLARFEELLTEKQLIKSDASISSRQEGLTANGPSASARGAAIADAQSGVDSEIRTLLGDDGYAKYDEFEETYGMRETVQNLQTELKYTAEPLTDNQAEKLVGLWYSAAHAGSEGGDSSGPLAQVGAGLVESPSGGASIPDNGSDLAASLLGPTQLNAVRDMISLQQLEHELRGASEGSD
jgi:hypothetical protein